MTRKFVLPLALSAAALCAVMPSAASAQWHGGGSIQFGYSSGYPYGAYDGSSYYDRGYDDNDSYAYRERHDRWDRDDDRRRYRDRDRGEHRGWRHHDDDDDDD